MPVVAEVLAVPQVMELSEVKAVFQEVVPFVLPVVPEVVVPDVKIKAEVAIPSRIESHLAFVKASQDASEAAQVVALQVLKLKFEAIEVAKKKTQEALNAKRLQSKEKKF